MSKKLKLTSMLLCLVMVLALFTGCGDKEAEEAYIQSYNQFYTDVQEINTKLSSLDPKEDLDTFISTVDEFIAILDEFSSLEAPERFAAAHDEYVTGIDMMIEYLDYSVSIAQNPESYDADKHAEMQQLYEEGSEHLTNGDALIQEATE